MPQLFSARADARLRVALAFGAGALVMAAAAAFAYVRSDRAWRVGVAAPQPIPFSHAIHAGGIGLDCRFCHAGVERQAAAGMPTAETCLGCHRQVWNVAAQFAPLETALALQVPVPWASVHRLPEHVRFHHGAHTAAGVACESCHGQVWTMPRTVKTETLAMAFCLDCHRDPAPRLRPAEAVFSRDWQPDYASDAAPAPGLATPRLQHFGVEIPPLTRCSTCHR
jgi:hypothetical protein